MRHLSKYACRSRRGDAAPTIVVTSGEPAGIGPDICAMLAARDVAARLIVLGDPDVLAGRIRDLGLPVAVETLDDADADAARLHRAGVMQMVPVAAARPVAAGRLDPGNARYVLRQLDLGVELCSGNPRAALVTAPVQKSTINQAGIPFTGHTEWLAARTGARRPVMMLSSPGLRVALATTHLPLERVAGAITAELLDEIVTVLHDDLQARFAVASPRIMVLGLNPHAGESGVLGREEIDVVEPALAKLAQRGLAVSGPVPADTAFTPQRLRNCDAVLAMYHDQGLPVIKALAFGETVNVTLGLPIVRTSVDHGTALDRAGSGRANPDSLLQAVQLAATLAVRAGRAVRAG